VPKLARQAGNRIIFLKKFQLCQIDRTAAIDIYKELAHSCRSPRYMWRRITLAAIALCSPMHGLASPRSMPALFFPNRGQAAPEIAFTARAPSVRAWLERGAVRLAWPGAELRVMFPGSARPAPEGLKPSTAAITFLGSSKPEARPVYSSVIYRGLYPGIDLIYSGESWLKSEFRVAAGADPTVIRLRYEGAVDVYVDGEGVLVAATPGGEIREHIPAIYQEVKGRRVSVAGGFQVFAGGEVGFALGGYDRSRELCIDPVVVFSSYFGGSGFDSITSVAVDAAGNCYVAGWTESIDLPVANYIQRVNAGRVDAFVAKWSPTGVLLYATYLGGSGNDRALGIAVDHTGSVSLTGSTDSDKFPLTAAVQNRRGGGLDAFVLRLTPEGDRIVFSTYLGGSGNDSGNGVAVDVSDYIYVAGGTVSSNFPVTHAVQGANAGLQDAFVTKFSPTGTLVYSSYLGGAADDRALGIAVTAVGEACITGSTQSTNFPVRNALQPFNRGGEDAFVAKLDASGTQLVYSTYLGGGGGSAGFPEAGNAIAVDSAGNVYVAGVTSSVNFPTSHALYGTFAGGTTDAFVVKLNATGSTMLFSTYLGGHSMDYASGIALDTSGNVYVAGYTVSIDFPVAQPLQQNNAGLYDAFIVELDPAGSSMLFGTYFGGTDADSAMSLAVDSSRSIYVAGQTLSYNFPVTSAGQSVDIGNRGGFVLKLRTNSSPSSFSVSPASGTGISQVFQSTAGDPDGWSDIRAVYLLIGSLNSTDACYAAFLTGSRALYLMNDTATGWLQPVLLSSESSVENSRCRVGGNGSSFSGSGQDITLNLAVTFKPVFGGTKNIYLTAADTAGALPGWQACGTWTIPYSGNRPPQPVSVSPASGAGPSVKFHVVASDPDGAADVAAVYVLVHPAPAVQSSCYMAYLPQSNMVYLFADNSTAGWLSPVALGVTGAIENSQCRVNAGTSSVSTSGTQVIIDLDLTFKPAYIGTQGVYVAVQDRANVVAGWSLLATWVVTAATNRPPQPVSVTPGSGSGQSQAFQFTVSDPDGAADIYAMYMLIGTGTAANSCYVAFLPRAKSLFLMNDAATGWLSPVTLGTTATLENTQCRINGPASSAAGAGTVQTLTLEIYFKSTFKGSKSILLSGHDFSNVVSGFLQVGSWTVN
jgi:hypothetical protein